jgi:hypothetical protein
MGARPIEPLLIPTFRRPQPNENGVVRPPEDGDGVTNPEVELEVAKQIVVEAEAAVTRQARLVTELQRAGHATKGSEILLMLFEEALTDAREALALLEQPVRPRGDKIAT